MAPIILAEFLLTIDIDSFSDTFWSDNIWYEKFLVEKLCDLSVHVGEWVPSSNSQVRNIRSFHPAKISFPGLPSHAESLKVQTIDTFNSDKERKMIIKESNSFRGIPYADYFNVNTEWIITSVQNSAADEKDRSMCHVSIHLDFTFHKSTWLQGTIESNTKAELIGVFELWRSAAEATIKQMAQTAAVIAARDKDNSSLNIVTSSDDVMDFNNDEINMLDTLNRSRSQEEYPYSVGYGSDEDLDMMFYDCEEGGAGGAERQQLMRQYRNSRSNQDSNSSLNIFGAGDSTSNLHMMHPGAGQNQFMSPVTPVELHQFYDQQKQHNATSGGGTGGGPLTPLGGADQQTSTRDLAVNIVETLFVLAEFSFWKVHTAYCYDLKELFNVEPSKVLSRVRNSFLPGWHSPVLLQPDIYGPLLAVLTLPQSLLISMETSKHGCNPTSQLGNAVVVSMFIWIGLSCIYRLLSLLIAPTIGLKHCLSMTGYSFFSWNLALLCSFPLELYSDVLHIPAMLPLVLLGIPSSLALGCMFWEQTPASTIQLQPASLPTSMQQFATNNSRWLQRVLWAFPKILAFVVVTGTHYQFLWYMARVFLPGRKQLCQLSALVQPSQYADILTQKELRKFAIMLLLGKKDD